MKFYNYSVKDMLVSNFGENTIFEMRKPHESVFKNGEDSNLLPLLWQYADEQAVGLCLEERFLLDTILEKDYIAYIIQFGDKKLAYLMFMVTEDEPLFHIDIIYAKQLLSEWESKGYSAFILRACIGVRYYSSDKKKGFHLGTHSSPGRGTALYEIKTINGIDRLVFCMHPCWAYYYQKLVFLSETQRLQEYECVFEPDVIITEGEEKNKKTLSSGIDAVVELLNSGPVNICYAEFEHTDTYSCTLTAGNKKLIISVDRRNLISEINLVKNRIIAIIDAASTNSGSLLDNIPELVGLRFLDPKEMHGYVLRLEYANGAKRNYYLKCFEERNIPLHCEIEGFDFTLEVFRSAKQDSCGNVNFMNGFFIPKHYLYYRSYRQVDIDQDRRVVYHDEEITIQTIYRLPLKEFKSHFSARQYRGWPEECFGPNMPWVDVDGNRISDVSIMSIDSGDDNNGAPRVLVEPGGRYGFLRKDGSWLAPPIYESATEYSQSCALVKRKENGKVKTFLLTPSGNEIPFDYNIDVRCFSNDRCAFSSEEWTDEVPDAKHYYDYDWVRPGKWGFIDSSGSIIVEPKYVYAIGFFNSDGEHSIVARFVNGKLLWGVIDLEGNEVVPCIYTELYCGYDGDVVVFQVEENGPYGLMSFDGHVIVEPQFEVIKEYCEKHRLITCGDYDDEVGVYSVDRGAMLIPAEFEGIDYDDHMISCESIFGKERYYDYNGQEIFFEGYDHVYESGGLLRVRKGEKQGILDWNRNILVPPIFENGLDFHMDYYQKGYLIVGTRKLKGLSRTNGDVILPEIYTEITFYGDYVVASIRNDTNWTIRDTLFTIDGKLLMEGPYRHMHIDNDGRLRAETPQGLVYFTISPYFGKSC